MMKIDLTEQMIKNIFIFLNRVDYKGLEEAQAITEIRYVFNQAIVQEQEKIKNITPTQQENK